MRGKKAKPKKPARKTRAQQKAQERPLSERERRFVEAFMGPCRGNGTDAARAAGYSGNDVVLATQASRLLRKAKVQSAIDARVAEDPTVLDRLALQRFWSETVRDPREQMKDRLKASELLGKSQAAFVERHEHVVEGAEVHFYVPDNGRSAEAPTD